MASSAACGRAEAGEQLEIGDRADIVRPDQAQPGDLVGRTAQAQPPPAADLRLGAGEQPADIGAVLPEDEQGEAERTARRDRSGRAAPAATGAASAADHPADRGIAGEQQGSRSRPRHKRRAPAGQQQARSDDADQGRDALAAAKSQPDRVEMAEQGAERGELRQCPGHSAPASSTAAAPLATSSSRVAAARPLRPVRSTLVAPILPEPIARRSPSAGEPGQQQAERDRAQQIAEQQRQQRLGESCQHVQRSP